MNVVPTRPDGVISATVMEPDADLIEKLESMLVDAKSGQLRAAGYTLIDRDRAICTGWIGHADHHDMYAGVNQLAFRYMLAGDSDD